MNILIYLRQFKTAGYAVFDLAGAFLGMFLLSPLLSKLSRKAGLEIPERNWFFLTLPIGIIVHLLIGNITPMTRNYFNTEGHYVLKIIITILFILGIRNIKRLPDK